MATSSYHDVLNSAAALPRQQQRELIRELESLSLPSAQGGRKHSIMELRGLGKEAWAGIEAQEYVNQERDSWGG